MANKDLASSLFLLAVGIVFTIGSLSLSHGSVHRPGSGFLPFYTGSALILIALASAVRSRFAAKFEGAGKGETTPGGPLLKPVAVAVAMALHAFMLPWLGYLPSTFILLAFLLKVGGFERWLQVLAIALLATALSHLLFFSVLNVRFPRGVLGF